MGGYYLLDSPSQQVAKHNTQHAITQSDLRSVAQCAVATHNAQINGTDFQDICIEQNGIRSLFICLDEKLKPTNCEVVRNKKPAFSYIVTATQNLDASNYNSIMEILEEYYADSGTFGLFQEKMIMAGGTATKRIVPAAIIEQMEITDGQLVYLTQYEIPDIGKQYEIATTPDIICPVGMAKVYRFGRWQCINYNTKTDCGGDMIWDSDIYECVPDESRKPLCADRQTAVMVENIWECVDPFPEKSCPDKMVARLNYNTLEWECVIDPTLDKTVKKCANTAGGAAYGALGATLRVTQTSCTDCERMVTDYETCKTYCTPDPTKINDPQCYPGNAVECTGTARAFYFGFPNRGYIANTEGIANITVPLDAAHSQNRRFNCLDCGVGEIDTSKSAPPYVAICK